MDEATSRGILQHKVMLSSKLLPITPIGSLLFIASYCPTSFSSLLLSSLSAISHMCCHPSIADALDMDDDAVDDVIAALPVPPLPRLIVASLRSSLTATWAEERPRANAAVTAGSTTERRRQRMEQVGVSCAALVC